jgi:hypothetical protein
MPEGEDGKRKELYIVQWIKPDSGAECKLDHQKASFNGIQLVCVPSTLLLPGTSVRLLLDS